MPPKKNDGSWERVETKLDLFKEHFDEHMKVVGSKLEKMDGRLDSVDVTVGKQQVTLEEHVRRTNILEDLREQDKKEIKTELEPIKAHVSQVKLFLRIAGWVLGGGIAAGGAGMGIKELIKIIFG